MQKEKFKRDHQAGKLSKAMLNKVKGGESGKNTSTVMKNRNSTAKSSIRNIN